LRQAGIDFTQAVKRILADGIGQPRRQRVGCSGLD
jgi:hypothetical protein